MLVPYNLTQATSPSFSHPDRSIMNLLALHSTHFPNSSTLSLSLSSKFSKPNPPNKTLTIKSTIPPRDRIIDFGKHKGKMLGALPSTYLKWVSTNLRARDFEHWAKLADQVLQDPVYKDRLEWEQAEKLLNGDVLTSRIESPVRELLEISENYGWDNEDKVGWSKIDFQLLGTSKGGRIPRVGERELLGLKRERAAGVDVRARSGYLGKEGCGGEKRGERRERVRLKRRVEMGKEKVGIRGKDGDGLGNGVKDEVSFERNEENQHHDRTVEIYNPFPGRESLLKKVINRKRVL